jgi:hypothetical protein
MTSNGLTCTRSSTCTSGINTTRALGIFVTPSLSEEGCRATAHNKNAWTIYLLL